MVFVVDVEVCAGAAGGAGVEAEAEAGVEGTLDDEAAVAGAALG